MKLLLILILQCTSLAFAKTTTLDRTSLLKKAPVPEKRKFPISKRSTPCQDFHHYVCAEVENKFKLPSNRERYIFAFSDPDERLLYAKKQFFNKIHLYKPPTERAAQFKDYYLACMNTATSAEEERKYVVEEKKRISKIKTWEELADLSQSRVDLAQTAFVGFDAEADHDNPLKNDLVIYGLSQVLPERSYYEQEALMKAYKEVLVDFFKTIGADKAAERAQWVADFEAAYAKSVPLPSELRERYSQKRVVLRADVLKNYPNLKLERFLETVPAEVPVAIYVPEGLEFYNKALAEMPLEQVKSYYMFRSIFPRMDDGYKEFFSRFYEFQHEHLGGPAKRSDRQERCTSKVSGAFGMELDSELINILFPNFPTEKIVKLSEDIRKAIIKGLEKNDWLSRSTRKEAVKKIQSAKMYVVKPQAEEDWNFMPVKKYSQTKPYANKDTYRLAVVEKIMADLKQDRRSSRWQHPPLIVDAFYIQEDNKFVLPMGILQFPFFDEDATDAENAATIGVIIGHELGHAIDDQGAKYDSAGRLRQWFSSGDLEDFKERGEKFISQFNKIGHDGRLTLGENIGDHVGLTFAYNAAFPDSSTASQEEKKNFFISYGRVWCSVSTPATQLKLLKTDPHAAPMERINQQVIHLDGFYEAFQCEDSDRMYIPPKERIRVW